MMISTKKCCFFKVKTILDRTFPLEEPVDTDKFVSYSQSWLQPLKLTTGSTCCYITQEFLLHSFETDLFVD